MEFPRKVYMIRHKATNKVYIGSSANVDRRYSVHLSQLRNGKHPVEDFQQDFDEHGEKLDFFILDEINSSDELDKEYAWMDAYESYKRPYGYNYKDVRYYPQRYLTKNAVSPYTTRRTELTDKIKSLVDRVTNLDNLEVLAGLTDAWSFKSERYE